MSLTEQEGQSLLDDKGRAVLADMISYWKGRSMSDRQQEAFTGDILKYWKYEGTFLWSHWTEGGIPNYEKIFRVGIKGLIQAARERLEEIDRETLIAAQEKPEAHQDLIVRVAGYSAYFVDLSKGLQDSIIQRTEQHFS